MKIRNGFVSNSSTASFVIKLDKLTGLQLMILQDSSKILGVIQIVKSNLDEEKFEELDYDRKEFLENAKIDDINSWNIDIEDDCLTGFTSMNNFDMHEFMIMLGIKRDDIKYGD